MSETAKSGRWFEKCIGDAEDEQVFVLILHNVVPNAQLCRRSLLFLGLPDQPLISAAELCLPLPVSISTIISCTGFHWVFPKTVICVMGSCHFAATPSLAKQPWEAAELGKPDSRAMLTDLSGINHWLHSSLSIRRMPSFDHVHVGLPVKSDWQPIASSVQGKIPVLTIWQLSVRHLWEWDFVTGNRLLEHAMSQPQKIPEQSSLTTINSLCTCLPSLDLV